jgi:hypothetical protein
MMEAEGPGLASGVIYGLHDIFLPDDYHEEWSSRYYNEQYLLAAYLLGGSAGDSILFPASFVARERSFRDRLMAIGGKFGLENLPDLGAGCFWMQRASRLRRVLARATAGHIA